MQLEPETASERWPRHAVPSARWYAAMRPPLEDTLLAGPARSRLVRFRDTPPDIEQPALTDNLVVLHLGGAKRVERRGGGRTECRDVAENSLTLMPAHQSNTWRTLGKVDYAHLSLGAGYLGQIAIDEFDRDPRELALVDRIGFVDPLLSGLLVELLAHGQPGPGNRMYQESLVLSAALRIIGHHSTLVPGGTVPPRTVRGGLAGWQMRRVIEYVAEHLAGEITVDGLVDLTGLSRAQFFRAFKATTGQSPHRYVTTARVRRAQELLLSGEIASAQVGRAVGLGGSRAFAQVFTREAGVHPRDYRRARTA